MAEICNAQIIKSKSACASVWAPQICDLSLIVMRLRPTLNIYISANIETITENFLDLVQMKRGG